MIIPLIFFLASATFSAPVALSGSETFDPANNSDSLGAYIEEYFADIPVMADIAWCESRNRHFDSDGEILRGMVDPDDVGVMQINKRFHRKASLELGYDVYTLHGNLAYARYLYEKEGTQPWRASQPCWGKIASQ
jgi:hypothetical protein